MKSCILLIQSVLLICASSIAQTPINKTIAVQNGQDITLYFDYPKLVKMTTWDKSEIQISGMVSINEGENDDAFMMEHTVNGKTIDVRSQIKNLKGLPQRVTVYRDGQKMIFKDKSEYKKYQDEHGRGFNTMSHGPDIDIILEIKVPRNVATRVESVYGMVEVTNFSGPLTVEATYGGVDAALVEKATGEVTAETNYGNIYTNLDVKFGNDQFKNEDFHTYVAAKPGSGPKYAFESKYGNVYIRKAVSN